MGYVETASAPDWVYCSWFSLVCGGVADGEGDIALLRLAPDRV